MLQWCAQREGGTMLVLEDAATFNAADKDDASFLITTWPEVKAKLKKKYPPFSASLLPTLGLLDFTPDGCCTGTK